MFVIEREVHEYTRRVELKGEIIRNRYEVKRAALQAEGDYEGMKKLTRKASPVRLKNRCKLTGRPKGYMRDFGICRNQFREMALMGKIPGVTKASW